MKKIQAFETSDGKIFRFEEEAKKHQVFIDFREWYENLRLPGNLMGSFVEFNDLVEYLTENKSRIKKLLSIL